MTITNSSSKKNKSKKRKSRSSRTIQISPEKLDKSKKMLPWIGYFVLGLTFLDYVFLLFPPHFLDPTWEINIIGHLTENVWAPLLGFALVFIRNQTSLKKAELKILLWLSRLMLLMAIVYFLSTPLIISNTIKIQQKSFSQLKTQLEIQKEQVAEFKKQLSKIPDKQLAAYLKQQQSQESSESTKNSSGTPLQQTLNKVNLEQNKSAEQAKKAYRKQKLSVIKRSTKWCMGAFFSGAIFLLFWKHTEWVRKTSPS